MTLGDGHVIIVVSTMGTVIATLAGAITWLTRRHLATLVSTVETQTKHIKICEDDRVQMKEAHDQLDRRTEMLEGAISMAIECPMANCPTKAVLKLSARQRLRPN